MELDIPRKPVLQGRGLDYGRLYCVSDATGHIQDGAFTSHDRGRLYCSSLERPSNHDFGCNCTLADYSLFRNCLPALRVLRSECNLPFPHLVSPSAAPLKDCGIPSRQGSRSSPL